MGFPSIPIILLDIILYIMYIIKSTNQPGFLSANHFSCFSFQIIQDRYRINIIRSKNLIYHKIYQSTMGFPSIPIILLDVILYILPTIFNVFLLDIGQINTQIGQDRQDRISKIGQIGEHRQDDVDMIDRKDKIGQIRQDR